jgi:hypothetical protein
VQNVSIGLHKAYPEILIGILKMRQIITEKEQWGKGTGIRL